jgi:hypothetical protein
VLDGSLVARPLGRRDDQLGQPRTENLLGRPAEGTRRGGVPVRDPALGVHAHERVDGRLDHRPVGTVGFRATFLRPLPCGHVHDHAETEPRFAVGPAHEVRREVGMDDGAGPGQETLFDPVAVDLARPEAADQEVLTGQVGRMGEVAQAAAGHLPGGVTEQFAEGVVHLAEAEVGADQALGDGNVGEHAPEQFLALLYRGAGPDLVGHVARHPDDADERTCAVEERRVGDPGGKDAAGAVLHRELPGPGPARGDRRHDLLALLVGRIRHREVADRSADCLVGAVPVEPLGGPVPVHDGAADVGGDDCLTNRVEHLDTQRQSITGRLERRFGRLRMRRCAVTLCSIR